MYIERKTDKNTVKKKPIVITEEKMRVIIRNVLTEVMSSFPNQYEIAELCTNELEKMVKNGNKQAVIPINKSGIHNVIINIVDGYVLRNNVYFKDSDIVITVGEDNIKRFDWNKMCDGITHELMHGNIFLWRYSNIDDKNEIEDTPESYETIVKILNKTDDVSGILYNYTYALYCCFYQETQALISQTYSSMKELYMKWGMDVINRDDFEEIFISSKPYETFYNNIWICDVIDGVSDNMLQQEIVDVYEKYNLETTIGEIRKNTNEIRRISNDAIHKCMKNASLFYNELEKYDKLEKE